MKTSKKVLVLNPEAGMRKRILAERAETMDVAVSSDFQYVLEHGKVPKLFYHGKEIHDYSLVFFRLWTKRKEISGPLYQVFSTIGVPCEADVLCQSHGNKITQLIKTNQAGIRIPKTVIVAYECITDQLDFIENHLTYPMIMKSVTADKGTGNYRVTSREDLIKTFQTAPQDEYIFQECIPNSFDYRFVVLDYKTKLIYKRIRKDDSSHLNNVSTGATTELVPLGEDKSLEQLAENIAKILSRTICGVDLMLGHDEKIYFLEGNQGPGLKSFNGMDILLDFIETKAFDLK